MPGPAHPRRRVLALANSPAPRSLGIVTSPFAVPLPLRSRLARWVSALGCLALFPFVALVADAAPASPAREFYREPSWQPRTHPTYEELVSGKFHPASPKVEVRYDTPGFAIERLAPPPAAGLHPRVLVTPDDVAAIRARVAQGDAAPAEFRALWQRVKESRSAFSALVAQDDALGRALAEQFVAKVRALAPKVDRLDAQPDAPNIWSAERSLVASGDPEPPHEIWTLLDYDYLHAWLTPAERTEVEKVIARLVKNRFSNFLAEPDHFMINNHKGFGMEFIRLLLLLEGTPEFPAATFRAAAHKCRAMLDWYLSPDGMCYESIKGWLNTSAFVAVGRRERDLLHHDHLVAKLRFFQSTLRWENGAWRIREEMRASAFHVIWLMRFLYPENPTYDLLYAASLSTHPFLTNPKERWPDPVGVAPELLLLFAGGGPGDDRAGKRAKWTTQAAIDALKFPVTWHDPLRGYVEARNSWKIGDLHLGFVNKQDFFYGGHEGSEANRLVLWKDGVNWLRDEDLLAVKATGLQNMLTVDGRGLTWPPVPGVWLGINESPAGLTAAGDARLAYTYGKFMQIHSLASPSGKLPYYAPFTERNFDLTRDLQVAFHPGTVKFNDGYAHTDYGPWSGETRLVEHYRVNNPMEQAYRTVHLARGDRPYVLVLDDARKDADAHLFEASFNLPDDVVVVDTKTTEVQFQNVEPSDRRMSEFLLATGKVARDPKTGRPKPAKGDPLLLVRILHRNTDYGYPVPRIQVLTGRPEVAFKGFSQLVVPAISRSPEFRILFYPHRSGDPLPTTTWNDDRSELTVALGGQRDVYRFARTDGGRTVFDFRRNNASVLAPTAAPARPVLRVGPDRYDANELRTTRREGEVPVFPFADAVTVAFDRVAAPAEIRYTLDGSEPTAQSLLYSAPFAVRSSATLRARVINPAWPGANRASAELTARFESRPAVAGVAQPPANSAPGLLARVYELTTKMWDDRGFFRANLVMLPDLDRATPLVTAAAREGFALPHAVPARPIADQTKGFYRFNSFFRAPAAGAYSFAVDSCGPVLLTVAGQDAIAETGVFHQQQAERRGTVVLGAGWHALELVVTDPLFWNLNTTGVMPFRVSVRAPGASEFTAIPAAQLAAVFPAGTATAEAPLVWREAEASPGPLERGVVRSAFERDGRNREPDYLDIDHLTPRRREPAYALEGNANPAQIVVYDGWFEAPMDGVYTFSLPFRRTENSILGEYRSAYQSQLRIGREVVLQRGVAGRAPTGCIGLKAGWHPLSLRLGSSPAELTATYPDGQTQALTASALRRPALVRIRPDGATADRALWEIYGPTKFTLSPPPGRGGDIRYTLDGSEPDARSPRATGPIEIAANTTLRAALFDGEQIVTDPASVVVRLVTRPEFALISRVDFSTWNGQTGFAPLDTLSRPWLASFAKSAEVDGRRALVSPPVTVTSGPGGVDINMTRGAGRVPLKLQRLAMLDPEFTVGLWFRVDAGDGNLFGKQGLTAFGKSYRTVSVQVLQSRLRADPGNLRGGAVSPGAWHHVVLSATPKRLALYLDGKLVANGAGAPGLATDALDFLPDFPGAIGSVAIYNRELNADEIARWHTAEKR
jgi:hypothetical protein